jgi:hypothetical protein
MLADVIKQNIGVLTPDKYKPKKAELEAAWILAEHYGVTVRILRPSMRYREKTPDFSIGTSLYELKTPISAKVQKVEQLIREATRQAENVVIDARRTKIHERRMIEVCRGRLEHIKSLKHVTLILDRKRVLDFVK